VPPTTRLPLSQHVDFSLLLCPRCFASRTVYVLNDCILHAPMEALAAISLLGSIIQFVEVTGKMIKTAKEIRQYSFGMTKENESLQESARQLRALSMRMEPSSTGSLSPDQSDLRYLARECRELSEKMLSLVKTKRASGSMTLFETFTVAISTKRHKETRKELEQKLQSCRISLQLQCNKLVRYAHALASVWRYYIDWL
jgi:hypothetical protein